MSNTTFKLFADKMGGTTVTNYIGTPGEIFYDQASGALRISNGVADIWSRTAITATTW